MAEENGNDHVCDVAQFSAVSSAGLKQLLLPNYQEEEDAAASEESEDTKKNAKSSISSLARKITGETIASFVLVFTICAVKVNIEGAGVCGTLAIAIISGLTVMVIIFSLGHVSGSHINPVVTIAYTAIRHFPLKLAPFYISAHILGAILATLLLEIVYHPKKNIGLVSPNSSVLQALVAETVAGFLLLFVASSVSTDTRAIGEFAGLAVGAIIAIDIFVVSPVSGGGINPARVLGPAIVSWDFQYVWIYVVGPITGGLCGALVYRLLRSKEGQREQTRSLRRRLS